MRYIMLALMIMIGGYANAHQWLPTYPKLEPSFVQGIYMTQLELFNSRRDVEYYQINVYDKDFNPIKFATPSRTIRVEHNKKAKVDVYIREEDKDKAVYICSTSKLLPGKGTATIVSSKICSKIK